MKSTDVFKLLQNLSLGLLLVIATSTKARAGDGSSGDHDSSGGQDSGYQQNVNFEGSLAGKFELQRTQTERFVMLKNSELSMIVCVENFCDPLLSGFTPDQILCFWDITKNQCDSNSNTNKYLGFTRDQCSAMGCRFDDGACIKCGC